MFNSSKIKKLKMENKEIQLEIASLKGALYRANEANRELDQTIKQLTEELGMAIKRVKELDGQLKMVGAQNQSKRFNDDSRNY
jgi:hypothetical protein